MTSVEVSTAASKGTAPSEMDLDDKAGHAGADSVDLEEKRRLECFADMEKIEKEFQDLKEKFYREKIEQINKELEGIQSGSHEKLLLKLKEAEQKKEEKIWAAEQWRQYQLTNIEHMFVSDKQQAEEELQMEKEIIKERMIQALQDRQRKLEDDKFTMSLHDGGTDIRGAANPSRNLRSTKKGKENAALLNHRAKKLNPSHINYTLKETEIGEDLALIQKALISRDRAKANEIFVERSQLHYYEKIFEKGTSVTVESVDGKEPAVSGLIALITPQEIQVKAADGNKARVTIQQLRIGRYNLKSNITAMTS